VLRPASRPSYLSSTEDKAQAIAALGVDQLIQLPFTQSLAGTSAERFVTRVYGSVQMSQLWVGADFAMGHHRDGDNAALGRLARELGFKLVTVPPLYDGDAAISSTRIRQLLAVGDVESASRLLAHPYGYVGSVVPGEQRGRQLGFRTANLEPPADRAMPAHGVYAVWVSVGERRYGAVANVGVRPSFGGGRRLVEVHLIDQDEDLYGQDMRVDFLRMLRPERTFESADLLVAQICRDIESAREVFETALG